MQPISSVLSYRLRTYATRLLVLEVGRSRAVRVCSLICDQYR